MPSVLIVSATRGLGASLAKHYVAQDDTTVYGTSRSNSNPDNFPSEVKWLSGVDLTSAKVGDNIVSALNGEQKQLDIVVS
jgi:NAD(P)-dependent dehydrogenase (short-subunit alcohol dehydrogenase family)